jgi:FimV-like protein
MMNFRLNHITALVVGLAFMWFIGSAARAADFAEVTVESVVGQQVSGFVELPQLSASDLASLEIKLASRPTYADNDVTYYSVHQDLRFQVKERTNGSVQLDISSNGPLREPKLNVLLRITWPDGDLLQGLTLSVPFTEAALVADKTVLTTSKDNLWQLAKRTRDGSRVSISQQMLAIQRLNPNAFSEGNINGLKSGYLLRIPDFMDAVEVDKASALAAVEGQHSQWRGDQKEGQKEGQKGDLKRDQNSVEKEGDKTPLVELGADLPPAERRGEVRIFQPESPVASGFDTEVRADADAAVESQASFEEAASSNSDDLNLPENVVVEASNNTLADAQGDDAKPVNIDQSVNDQIDLMMAEENQGSYSAQFVWLVAGGILGVLIVIMLLRRQMAERKKNLEDAWVAEADSDAEIDAEIDDEAEHGLKEAKLDQADPEPLDSQDDPGTEPDTEEDFEERSEARSEEAQQEGAEAEEEVTGPIEPSIAPVIAPVTAPINAPDISPTEETAPTTVKDETFLEVLNGDEAPLEETSNTEVYTTRLKLAEAYLEMGDEAGARDMLNEVVAEGDDAQKTLAKSIIQRIDDALDDSKDT